MGNQLQLFQRIKSSTLIDFTGAHYDFGSTAIARAVGDTVDITALADGGSSTTIVTAADSGMVLGEHVTLTTASLTDTYEVVDVTDEDIFTIGVAYPGQTETGTFVDAFQESPVGGIVQRLFYPEGASSGFVRINLDDPQNVYPNCGMIFKINNTVTPTYKVAFQTSIFNNSNFHQFEGLNQRLMGFESNEWGHFSFINGLKVTGGSPPSWATDEDDQAFSTHSINVIAFTGSAPAGGLVFYIAAVYTDNFPKAKLILTFDDFPDTVNSEAFPKLNAKGWKAGAAPTGSEMDTAPNRARIQQLHDAGWDIMNHTWNHLRADETMSDGTWIDEALRNRNWQIENGWTRGSNFIAYPNTFIQLTDNNGGAIADRYFALARGFAYREMYGSQNRSSNRGDDTLNNQIPDDAINIQAIADSSATVYATGAAGSVKARLAEVNLSHGVMVVFMHGIVTPASGSDNTVEWFDAFLADIQTYVDAGTLEVVRMSDWYEELSGMPADSISGSGGGGGVLFNQLFS